MWIVSVAPRVQRSSPLVRGTPTAPGNVAGLTPRARNATLCHAQPSASFRDGNAPLHCRSRRRMQQRGKPILGERRGRRVERVLRVGGRLPAALLVLLAPSDGAPFHRMQRVRASLSRSRIALKTQARRGEHEGRIRGDCVMRKGARREGALSTRGKQVSEKSPTKAEVTRWADAVSDMLIGTLAGLAPKRARGGRSSRQVRFPLDKDRPGTGA
jgi:hypothetical protein